MDSNNLDYQRRCAVSRAWSNERRQVMNFRGSRNWSQKEQKEIIATGKCHGYEGQHMLSVKGHPSQAGNERNIQFLTHEEHFRAHGGNWKNDANGRYNLRTGKVEQFENGVPNIKYRKLSDPISERLMKIANHRYQKAINAKRAKRNTANNKMVSKRKLVVHKTTRSIQDKYAQGRDMFNSKVVASQKGNAAPFQNKRTSQNRSTVSKNKGHGIS